MERTSLIQFLAASGHMSLDIAKEVAAVFNEMAIGKNDYLLKEGQVNDCYYFLDSGCMRAFAHDVEGNDVTTGFYLPRNVVFDVSSFFNRTRSKENIQALTDCEGWYITYEELNMLFHSMQQFREFGRGLLVRGYTALKTRTLGMITDTAEERYASLLHTYPEILQQVPLKHIATYLGITDSSLSRIRREFSQK